MFSHHKAGISTIRQLKIIEEVKKPVDQKKKKIVQMYHNRKISRKAKKLLKTLRKILSRHCTLFREIPPKILNVILIHLGR